ncbi:hypothetical protein HF1_11730 [Mycoplasma haemofelis str. Langford 1]|uniref:Lipoprotein n=1 Tax=Mycoplasma haemofelis (strain Langford 1) TaxID=941640 RepID=E8ZJ60_MYCHL|nr:hypothetical protein [Mycoplasma haemofelis]CBY93181.1 hypothetical protein HF1_11730 [Mycoplasma haemofelis str. Langford 1]
MKLGTSLLLGGASATGAAAAAGGYYVLSSKEPTIKEELKSKKFIPFSDSSQWDEEFKSDSTNIKASIKALEGATDNNGGSKLKEWCESQMELDAKKHSKSLELVSKYCLIRDLASQLSRKGKTLLSSNSSESEWKATYSKRQNKSTSRAEVNLTGSAWTETTDLPLIRKWCEDNSKKDFLASNKNDIYSKLENWCTKEAASEQ